LGRSARPRRADPVHPVRSRRVGPGVTLLCTPRVTMATTLPSTVRLARPEDAADVARIYNQGIEERIATFETEPRSPEQIRRQLEEKGDRYPTVVVEREGRVVAWAAVSSYRSRPCYAGVGEFSVYVDRAARGSGAGRAALQGLFRACEERGFW